MLLAYVVNELGTWFGYVALAVGVYDSTHSAFATAALFVARGILPALLAPVLVVRVERSPRRGSLAALYLLEGILTLGLAALIWHFWLPGVLILVALDGSAAVAAAALVRATAAHIAEREEDGEIAQRRAYASLNVTYMVAFAIGPVLGGVLVDLIGGPRALVADAASFLLCALILLDFRTNLSDDSGGSIRSQLADAWHHIQNLPALRTLLITEAVALVFFASVEPVEVIYAKHTLTAGDAGLGVLLGAWGVGAALGAILYARALQRSLGAMLTLGTLFVGLAYLGFAAAPTIAIACVAAVVGGVGNGIQWPALVSSVQRLTPSEMQGRLMGAIGSLGVLCPSLGFALGGTIAALSSTRIAMLVAGSVASLATLAFTRIALIDLGAEEPPPAAGSPPRPMPVLDEVKTP
ncbi:MAG TPA: MFS transporter [Solirubrobacteraceae bacterium]